MFLRYLLITDTFISCVSIILVHIFLEQIKGSFRANKAMMEK